MAALVLGIIGTVFSLLTPVTFSVGAWLGIPLSLIAIVLGVFGRKSARASNLPTGTATAGMVLGIVGLALGVTLFSLCAYCFKKVNDAAQDPQAQQEFNETFRKALEENGRKNEGQPPPAPAAPAPPAGDPAPAK